MITYQEALRIINSIAMPSSVEEVSLEAAAGRYLAADLKALVPSPPYTNSAMDGFAVRHADLVDGEYLTISGVILAGAPASLPAPALGACQRIMTGALLPAWADTVIPVELATVNDDGLQVRFASTPGLGANIRRQGEDLEPGTLALKAGTYLDPERIMVAAALGHRHLLVKKPPQIVILCTGDELVDAGEALRPGAVYNSNKYFLLAATAALGLTATCHVVPDDEEKVSSLLGPLLSADQTAVVISTGAVSAGTADFIPNLTNKLGFETLFHRVAIRPGKPVFLAHLSAGGKTQVVWLGLPGNQISTCVGWHFFARPLLSSLAGATPVRRHQLVLKTEIRKPENLRCFYRAEVNGNRAWISPRQGSSHLAASLSNEAYVELPEGMACFPVETRVEAVIVGKPMEMSST